MPIIIYQLINGNNIKYYFDYNRQSTRSIYFTTGENFKPNNS